MDLRGTRWGSRRPLGGHYHSQEKGWELGLPSSAAGKREPIQGVFKGV